MEELGILNVEQAHCVFSTCQEPDAPGLAFTCRVPFLLPLAHYAYLNMLCVYDFVKLGVHHGEKQTNDGFVLRCF